MGAYLAPIYQYIYMILVAIVTFANVGRYKTTVVNNQRSSVGDYFLVFFMILFIGLRPLSGYFVDMVNYYNMYERFRLDTFLFTWDTDNIIYDNLLLWWASNDMGIGLFFLLIAAIYFICAYIGIKRLFPTHALIAYIVFLGAFSTFSYATNGIKAGAAASIFVMALGYSNKLAVCIPLMLVSLGFHHSMVVPVAAFVLTLFFKTPKWYYYGWFFCFLMALLHISYFQYLFGGMADEHGAEYLLVTESNSETFVGFRPDFVLYSAIPVIIGYIYEIKRKISLSKSCTLLMHLYLTTNAIWMLCMYAEFSNRIAYLSWFLYPIVIIFPFIDSYNNDVNKYNKLRKTVIYHLSFTLLMVFVYYGLLSLHH